MGISGSVRWNVQIMSLPLEGVSRNDYRPMECADHEPSIDVQKWLPSNGMCRSRAFHWCPEMTAVQWNVQITSLPLDGVSRNDCRPMECADHEPSINVQKWLPSDYPTPTLLWIHVKVWVARQQTPIKHALMWEACRSERSLFGGYF